MNPNAPSPALELLQSLFSLNGNLSTDEVRLQLGQIRDLSPESSELADRLMLEQLELQRTCLRKTQEQVRQFRSLLDHLSAPPWHSALFHSTLPGGPPVRAIVRMGQSRRVVSLGEGMDAKTLRRGDEVFLNAEQTLIVGRSQEPMANAGETALFERRLPDGRIMVRWHEDLIVLEISDALQSMECKAGDAIRFDRNSWMAFERIESDPGQRYVLDEIPDIPLGAVGGQSQNLEELLSVLSIVLLEPERAAAYGLSGRNSILMCGPPGCGKTLMARVAVSHVARISKKKCRFSVVKPAEWESPWVGQTQENIRQCFQAVRDVGDDGFAIVFFDEIESIGRIRGGSVSHHSDKFLAALLAELDGFKDRRNVAIICATNRKDLLDAALYERLSDLEITVTRPDLHAARSIFEIHLPESLPFHPNGPLAASTRRDLIDRAVSRFYSPNAGNDLCRLRFRDGQQRTVSARELASGRLFESISRTARRHAFLRELEGGVQGVQTIDMEEAIVQALDRLRTVLTIHNAHSYLADLPQDVDVVSVEPILRKVKRVHRYLTDSETISPS